MNRALSMLGLCARAGKLLSGEKAVVNAVRTGAAYLVLLDEAASANAEKAIADACSYYEIPLLRTEANALGDAIGKSGRMAVAVTDAGFAQSILKKSAGM